MRYNRRVLCSSRIWCRGVSHTPLLLRREDQNGGIMSDKRDWQVHNQGVISEFRANGGKESLLLLTTTGAKSGLPRITPLVYTTDGDRIIIIASKGGAPSHPDWYYNLIAHPEATVELGREQFQVRASVAE